MRDRGFSWKDPQLTYADALTGARLVILPYLLYGLIASLPGMTIASLLAVIATDLVDGTIARRTGQSRSFGAVFDSTVDFVVIYSAFTTLYGIGILPWWKWLPIAATGFLIAGTQITSVRKTHGLTFAPVRFGKLVGQVQFVYLPLLLARAFWVRAGWAQVLDNVVFGILAAAMIANAVDHVQILSRLVRPSAGRGG
ncbi:MAG: CDP-alcohol phosphatidyltransferase family protein [Armatimonadota bacterium]